MRSLSIALVAAMAASLGSTIVAQAAPCKGSLTYGSSYLRRMGGGYMEYLNTVHNTTARELTFTMRVWGLRAPDSAKAATQILKVGAGRSLEVGVAYTSSQYFGQNLQRTFDVSTPNNFPTLSLTDCSP